MIVPSGRTWWLPKALGSAFRTESPATRSGAGAFGVEGPATDGGVGAIGRDAFGVGTSGAGAAVGAGLGAAGAGCWRAITPSIPALGGEAGAVTFPGFWYGWGATFFGPRREWG